MGKIEILNSGAVDPSSKLLEPVELSRRLLGEARVLKAPTGHSRLEDLAGQLRIVDPLALEDDEERIAFWINVYNALLLHIRHLMPVTGSVLRSPKLFSRFGYELGALPFSLNLIEHGVLRRNSRAPFQVSRALKSSDPRAMSAPSRVDPRIHFALNCGARSCPPIETYDEQDLDSQLEAATRSYMTQESRVDVEEHRVVLPRLMRLYAGDFGGREDQLNFAARYLPELESLRSSGSGKLKLKHGGFDWAAVPLPGSQRL